MRTPFCSFVAVACSKPIFYAKQKIPPLGWDFCLAQEEGFEPPCLLGKRFSRLSKVFPKRSCLSLILPDFPDIQAYSSQLPGNLRENCEKAARKRQKTQSHKCRTYYKPKITSCQLKYVGASMLACLNKKRKG